VTGLHTLSLHMVESQNTGSAVTLHCVEAYRQSQWRSPNFNPL